MKERLTLCLAALSLAFTAACGGGGTTSGGAQAEMDLIEVSNGFGLMVPHQVFKPDPQGFPTQQLVAIRSQQDLLANVTLSNPILPTTEWPTVMGLPNGDPGNHFLYAEFTQDIAIDSVLDPTPSGQANSGLIGPITVLAFDPSTGQSVPVKGRAFVGGKTYAGTATGTPPLLPLQQWVGLDANGKPIALDVGGAFPGLGFPGTQSTAGFTGANKLASPRTFVFVVDSDGDLTTHETFPLNRQIRIRATTAMKAQNGESLKRSVLGSATVGVDTLAPEVAVTPPPNPVPVTTPSFGDTDVDPSTTIKVEFTEPLQPLTLMPLPTGQPPGLSSAISIQFGPTTQVTQVPFTGLPLSVYDLSVWEFTPVFAFPGNGPAILGCGTFNTVTVVVVPGQFQDLAANLNTQPASTFFTTGEGPGLVNAPVTPDAIYAGRFGAKPGISVIDLNGFGQSTGNPTFDFTYTSFPKGNSNFPNNPNVKLQGTAIRPPLFPGTCTVDGGSQGAFTLTRDSSLNTLLLASPLVTSVGDMAIGHSLDLVFNNGKDTTGCQSGGGNICAITGKKNVQVSFASTGPNPDPVPGNLPNQPVVGLINQVPGGANPVSWSPHPNPPPLVFPPLCIQPFIGGQEPTAFHTIAPPPPVSTGLGLSNLLNPGDPFGKPLQGIPPSGLLVQFQNTFFEGPDIPSKPLAACLEHMHRQQIGHFLYVVDRSRHEIVVLNSNRFQVLDRIPMSDPTDLAMGPNLDFLAVTNQNSDTVSFIDIDPQSSTFHQVVKNTPVGRGPRGIAWDPGNEDILVCNELDSTVSVISAFSLAVRKTAKSHLNQPFDVAITQRQFGFGFLRNVYFGWILNRNGDLTLFESGPNGINGWGFDDTIGVAPFEFDKPKKIAVDFYKLGGGVWIVHESPLDPSGTPTGIKGGAVTNVVVDSAVFGIIPLTGLGFVINPQFREMTLKVEVSIGPDQLTGIPVDLAFDNMRNTGALSNFLPTQGAGLPLQLNGKSYVRALGALVRGANQPRFMFLAIPNSTSAGAGAVDVINILSGNLRYDTDPYLPGIQSIPVPGVGVLCDYWRQ
ncbi:MAG TPA: beta-propeller fold lactonase family protein [Planctomycetota bacterium]|nr:beta-propeller fold lactonase family protein [Planctomycetota bacterium]